MISIDFDKFDELTTEDNQRLGILLSTLRDNVFSLSKRRTYTINFNGRDEKIRLSHSIMLRLSKSGEHRYQVIHEKFYIANHSENGYLPVVKTKLHSSFSYLIVKTNHVVTMKSCAFAAKSRTIQMPGKFPWSPSLSNKQQGLFAHENKMTLKVYPKTKREMSADYYHTKKESLVLERRFKTYFFTSYFEDCDLYVFNRIGRLKPLQLHEKFKIIKNIFYQLHQLHVEKRMVLRDLKPENIMLNIATLDTYIIDFDYSKNIEDGDHDEHRSGSAYYISPEQLKLTSTTKSDCYAMGLIVAFIMFSDDVCALLPMTSDQPRILAELYGELCETYSFGVDYDEIAAFIEALSDYDPESRPTAEKGFEFFRRLEENYQICESSPAVNCPK